LRQNDEAKKVARLPEASGSSALQAKNEGAGLCAAPAAHPVGHSLRECSLRHPASAVRIAPE